MTTVIQKAFKGRQGLELEISVNEKGIASIDSPGLPEPILVVQGCAVRMKIHLENITSTDTAIIVSWLR